jgi:type IV pilus assembly protein PilN
MIRINLLAQRKSKRSERGEQSALFGLLVVIVVGAAVFFLVHRPLEAELASQQQVNHRLQSDNKSIRKRTKHFDELKSAVEVLEAQEQAISQLNAAKATPAWLLDELSRILTPGRQPTMTKAEADRASHDQNRIWDRAWDPKHVWINSFSERKGKFKLKGGAQSDSDMTQLALRLQASAYFLDVLPQTGDQKVDKETGIAYHEFTITGKVRY